MPQSPYTFTVVSSVAQTVELKGLYRKMQVSIGSNSSSVSGQVWVTHGPTAGNRGVEIFHNSTPDSASDAVSPVSDGFFDRVNVYTTADSSAISGTVTVKLYFDGAQWP